MVIRFPFVHTDNLDVSLARAHIGVMGNDISERLARLESGQGDIKAALSQLTPMLVRIMEEIAGIKGRLADAPTARDFGRLEGRVAEMSERLPTTIGYRPPAPGKKTA